MFENGGDGIVALRNYQEYTVSQHAKERILTRFNITNQELEKWLTRLLSQCAFVEQENERRTKYRLNDIVIIADTKQQVIITVYSINEHDDTPVTKRTNPEVQTAIKEAVKKLIDTKRIKTANKISEKVKAMYEANQKMINPNTRHDFTNRAWEEFIQNFNDMRSIVDSAQSIIQEAQQKAED